jgi:S1-C subfamily serine protease
MKSFSLFLIFLVLAPGLCLAEKKAGASSAAVTPAPEGAPRNTSLVKVNVTNQGWNYRIPWQKTSPGQRRGLGVLMEKNQILVTAQLVADATYIELEQAGTGQKLAAKVKAVDYEANLALLEPAQAVDGFFSGLKAMTVETGSHIGDALQVWQLDPRGELVRSEVDLSKINTSRYVLESSLFLAYETNGIIRTEANSFTLPVVRGGRLVGLVLRYDSKNQSATVLPGPIIAHFLKDMTDGNYQGFPNLGIEYQTTLDDQFREYLGMSKNQQGVYVSNVSKGGSAESAGVQKGDIILEMNGHAVDDRGDYNDTQFGRLNVSHIVRGQAFVGDPFKVKVLRDGKETMLTGKLIRKNPKDYLVWPYLFDRGPNYLVMGGLIFQELSLPFLQSFGEDWENSAPLRLIFIAKHTEEYEKKGRRKVVFLAGSLPTRSTQGYERLGGHVIDKVNGKEINDLADLAAAFKEPKDGLHKIEMEEAPRFVFLDAITSESDNMRLLNGVYRLEGLKRID